MNKSLTVIEYTNENIYEVLWNARLTFVQQKLAHLTDLYQSLDAFTMADVGYSWEPEVIVGELDDGTQSKRFLNGKINLLPFDPKTAEEQRSVSRQTQNRRAELILQHIEDDMDAIVELGAGYGLGLFRLAQALRLPMFDGSPKRNIPLYMAEYTESGRALCETFMAKANAPHMSIHPIDHKAPDLSFLEGVKKPLIMTVHSIEQVETLPDDYFHTLAAVAPSVRGFHLEPIGFQIDPSDPKNAEHAAYIAEQGWNQNFYEVLRRAEKDGVIEVDKIERDCFVIHDFNPGTLVTWRSRA